MAEVKTVYVTEWDLVLLSLLASMLFAFDKVLLTIICCLCYTRESVVAVAYNFCVDFG